MQLTNESVDSLYFNKLYYRLFIHTYLKTFPFDGFDPVRFTINGKQDHKFNYLYYHYDYGVCDQYFAFTKDIKADVIKSGILHPGRLISSFFGIPNRKRHRQNERVPNNPVIDMLLNFIDWPDRAAPSEHKDNMPLKIAKAVGLFIWNSIAIPFATIKNIFKFVTQYIPAILTELSYAGLEACRDVMRDTSSHVAIRTLANIGFGLAGFAYFLFRGIHAIGRAITSPITSMHAAYRFGVNLFKKRDSNWRVIDEKINGKIIESTLGKVLGVVLAGLSIAVTVIAYTVLFPLGIKAISTAFPEFAAKIVCDYQPIINLVKPVLETVGTYLHTAMPFLSALSSSPAITAASIFFASAMTTIGFGFNKLKRMANKVLRRREYAEYAEEIIYPTSSATVETVKGSYGLFQENNLITSNNISHDAPSDTDDSRPSSPIPFYAHQPAAQLFPDGDDASPRNSSYWNR